MISAVMVTYNSSACIGRCLESLRDKLPDAELVVVDNASVDDTISAVREAAPQARLLESGANVGFGRACNIGAEAARGSHVLFVNPDAAVAAVDHENLDRLLGSRPFGLIAPSLEGDHDRLKVENSWLREYVVHTFGTVRPREWSRPVHRGKRGNATWASGAMLLVSRHEFLELGGFDPRFFLYYEDRDLSRRYRNANLPLRATETIRGRHAAGTSSAPDGLRVGPMAWNLLGWIQYLFIYDGERTARRAARVTLTTLRLLRLGVHGVASLRWTRARRKARQLDDLFDLLAKHVSNYDGDFCPDAHRVVRGLV